MSGAAEPAGSTGVGPETVGSDQHGAADTELIHTNLEVEMGCPVCLNETVEALNAEAIVDDVIVHSADGCFEVTHHGKVEDVITVINRVGHGVDIASNGEMIMTPIKAVAVGTCRHQPSV